MTIANIKNIETVLLRKLTAQEAQHAQMLLNHAESLIRERVPNLENLCDADADFSANVAHIEAQAAARVIRGDGRISIVENELAQLRQNQGISLDLATFQKTNDILLAA